jgi:hypothetical protein
MFRYYLYYDFLFLSVQIKSYCRVMMLQKTTESSCLPNHSLCHLIVTGSLFRSSLVVPHVTSCKDSIEAAQGS